MFNSRSAASATSSNSRYARPLVCGTAVADEGRRPGQPGLAHDVLEVGDVRALGEGHRLATVVDAVLRRDLLDVIGLHAELPESVHPVQDGARVAAVPALGRDHARHQDRAHPTHRRRAGLAHVVEHALPVRPQSRIARVEMRAEPVVVIEPPQRRARKQQVLVPPADGRFERRDRGGAVARVITDVDARVGLRKVAAGSAVELQEVVVALADDHHVATRRHDAADHVPDVAHEIPIRRDQRPARRA